MGATDLLAQYLCGISESSYFPLTPLARGKSVIKATFVDGGEGVLLDSSTAALCQIRIAKVEYAGVERLRSKTEEYTVLAAAARDGVEISIEPPNNIIPKFFSWRELGLARPRIKDFAGYVRRLLEIDACSRIDGQCILDGNLVGQGEQEKALLANCISRGVIAISKTNSLADLDGRPLIPETDLGCWLLGPLQKGVLLTYAAKLHPKGRIVRMDCKDVPAQETLNTLAAHSCDPTMFGYPYGLISADLLARIANDEARYLAAKMEYGLMRKRDFFGALKETQDAHALLDMMAHRDLER